MVVEIIPMKTLCMAFIFSLASFASAEVTVDTVIAMLRQQTIAANQNDVAKLVSTVPEKGVAITHATGETVTLSRAQLEDYLAGYFKKMKPGSYLYGTKLCSVDAKEKESITVTVEVSESFVLSETGVATTSWYREKVTLGQENGRPVVLKSVMEKPENANLQGADLPVGK